MLLKYRIISGTIWNSISSSFTTVLNIGTVALLARLLTPEDFGLFAMLSVVINLLQAFADMGISAAVISFRDIRSEELSSLFYFNIVLGIVMALLMIVTAPLLVYYFQESRIYWYLWILSLNFVITSPGIIYNLLLKKQMKFDILSKINIIANVGYSGIVLTYAIISRDLMSLVVGTLAQAIINTILTIYFGRKLLKPGAFVIKYSLLKRFLSFGLYQVGERLINRFNWNIDYLLIGRFLGAEALGYYSIAYNLMLKPIQKINPIITSVAFPAFSEIQDDDAQLKKYFLKMVRYICYVMAPIYLLFFILSEHIILILYGDKWLLAVPVFAVFSFLGFLYALGNPNGSLILAKGRADIGFWVNVVQTIFLLIANYIGVHYGIIGVAISTLLVTLVLFFPLGFWVRYFLVKIRVGEYMIQLKHAVLFASAAGGIVLLIQKYLISTVVMGEVIIFSMIFGLTYVGLLGFVERTEFVFIRDTLKDYFKKKQ